MVTATRKSPKTISEQERIDDGVLFVFKSLVPRYYPSRISPVVVVYSDDLAQV